MEEAGPLRMPGRGYLQKISSTMLIVHLHLNYFTLGNSEALAYDAEPEVSEMLQHGNVPGEWQSIGGMAKEYKFVDHRREEQARIDDAKASGELEGAARAEGAQKKAQPARPAADEDDPEAGAPRQGGMCNACFEVLPNMTLQQRKYLTYIAALAIFAFAWFFMAAVILVDPVAWYYWLPGIWATVCFLGMNAARITQGARRGAAGTTSISRRETFGCYDLVFAVFGAAGFLWFCPPLLILIYEHGRGEPPHPALAFIIFVQPLLIFVAAVVLAVARHVQPPRRALAKLEERQ